jgi:phage shock protein A
MKNRISMALKDPILQQGFEIICKDLAISEHDREHNDYELTEAYKKIEQLEKENAELKKQLEDADNATDCFNKQEEIIAKAKEIIREFVEWANWQGSKCPSFKSIQGKAEQFLKDSEVEK